MSRLTLTLLTALFLFGCGDNIKLKKTEYLINGEWLQCSLLETNPCGETLKCGDRVFQCQINLEMRLR